MRLQLAQYRSNPEIRWRHALHYSALSAHFRATYNCDLAQVACCVKTGWVKTSLLGLEKSSSKCSVTNPNNALWRIISASRSQNRAGMFLHYSVHVGDSDYDDEPDARGRECEHSCKGPLTHRIHRIISAIKREENEALN